MTKIIIVNNSQTDTVKLRLKETANSAVDVGTQSGAVHHDSPYLDIGLAAADEVPLDCIPNDIIMTEGKLTGGSVSVHLKYAVEAKGHNVNEEEKRFSFTSPDNDLTYSKVVEALVDKIKADHPFITFEKSTGSGIANFRFWTYSSDTSGEFRFDGASNALSTDPITIKLIKSNEPGDLFSMLFPDDFDAYEKYVHSCGTQEFIGI